MSAMLAPTTGLPCPPTAFLQRQHVTATSRVTHQQRRALAARRAAVAAGSGGASGAASSCASAAAEQLGVVIVDHGSRKAESNDMLFEFVELYRQVTGRPLVEGAHMELAEPTIEQAVSRCAAAGATRVIVAPYFLSRGRHVQHDIPALVDAAAAAHPGVEVAVADPIGIDTLMAQLIENRVAAAAATTAAGSVAAAATAAEHGAAAAEGESMTAAAAVRAAAGPAGSMPAAAAQMPAASLQ